jgi:hypothetical protein
MTRARAHTMIELLADPTGAGAMHRVRAFLVRSLRGLRGKIAVGSRTMRSSIGRFTSPNNMPVRRATPSPMVRVEVRE